MSDSISHDIPTLEPLDNTRNNPILTLTEDDLIAFDPLTRLAAQLMIKNGKAVLLNREAG